MTHTPRHFVPLLAAGQAQKHVTHNDALLRIDQLLHLTVASNTMSTPPTSPVEHTCYLPAAGATGAWAGKDGMLALWQEGVWTFETPRPGWRAYVLATGQVVAYSGTEWTPVAGERLDRLGVNAGATSTQRFAVASDTALFTHDTTGGHQISVNKAAPDDTASLLYQTGYSGRAEIGTAGDDKLHIKVSADGASWKEAMVIASDGKVGFGTANPAGFSSDVVFAGNAAAPLIVKVANQNAGATAQARFDVSLPGSTAYASFALVNGAAPYGLLAGGAGVSGLFLDWGQHIFRSASGAERFRIDVDNLRPGTDNAFTLGTASRRWSTIYAATGTINTSDLRDKSVVGTLAGSASGMVGAVEPILFRWREDDRKVGDTGEDVVQGRRIHAGFRAQDIRLAMVAEGLDFAAWGLDDAADPESRQWLRPDELLPILWQAVRELKDQVAALDPGSTDATRRKSMPS